MINVSVILNILYIFDSGLKVLFMSGNVKSNACVIFSNERKKGKRSTIQNSHITMESIGSN